jgi:2-polyprenyl-3-methyl-5-hydroxy-6-metoxy-1,4-benzoquinol methylase
MKDQRNGDSVLANPDYVLGHADRELERLNAQERLVGPFTRQIFRDAGIVPGMRVLDIGSGAGDVAFLAADLVGHDGEVVGTDNAPAAVAAARARASERLLHNVEFREGDPAEMVFERPFDAVVGRYVLTFQVDPAAMLRKLAGHLRWGGVVVFHEPDWAGAQSFPPSPTYDRCNQWIVKTFRSLGIETRMGVKLHETFIAAGLPAPSMRLNAIIGGEKGGSEWMHQIAELVSTLLPAMEQLGVTTAAEVDIETLADRLHGDLAAGGGIIVGRSEIGAWSRV